MKGVYSLIDEVDMSMFTEEQIEKLAVCRVDQRELQDSLGNFVQGGLGDERMGPNRLFGICRTCGQGWMTCKGHYGYIQLAVPAYNPLTFTHLIRLLNRSCEHCHRMRLPTTVKKMFKYRFALLKQNKLMAARKVAESFTKMEPTEFEHLCEKMLQDDTEEHVETQLIKQEFDATLKEMFFFKNRCSNCYSAPSKLVYSNSVKILRQPSSFGKKQQIVMQADEPENADDDAQEIDDVNGEIPLKD